MYFTLYGFIVVQAVFCFFHFRSRAHRARSAHGSLGRPRRHAHIIRDVHITFDFRLQHTQCDTRARARAGRRPRPDFQYRLSTPRWSSDSDRPTSSICATTEQDQHQERRISHESKCHHCESPHTCVPIHRPYPTGRVCNRTSRRLAVGRQEPPRSHSTPRPPTADIASRVVFSSC